LRRLVLSFHWLELHGKSPMDLGLSPDDLDPGWEEAMIILKHSLEAERSLVHGR
jgi:hypothetical protein